MLYLPSKFSGLPEIFTFNQPLIYLYIVMDIKAANDEITCICLNFKVQKHRIFHTVLHQNINFLACQ